MRVVAGQYRSRQLLAPRGMGTRPTSDRLRETLFNVLGPRLPGARFADLYAGSGAVGIEALSRGASFCSFAERAPAAVAAIRANLTALQIRSNFILDSRSVGRVLAHGAEAGTRFDLVFLDPPYEAAEEYTTTLNLLSAQAENLLAPGALVIAEHARRTPLSTQFGQLFRSRLLEQGDAALSFYAVQLATQD
ncbi:MAG: 16S rRNA (guanine(966)-N(2))-methyltransferase RsmD [Janthinobacterium lividum]